MIECVLFDLDGVLVDACEWHYDALNQALKQVAGTSITREEHVTTFNGLPTNEKLKILTAQKRLDPELHKLVWERKQDLTENVIENSAQKDDLKIGLLVGLAELGIKVGCVTNSIRKTATMMLELTGQISFIENLLTNEDVEIPKPNCEGYEKAMSIFKVEPSKTLIVEDSEKGFQAAKSSNAHVLRVSGPQDVNFENIKVTIEKINSSTETQNILSL